MQPARKHDGRERETAGSEQSGGHAHASLTADRLLTIKLHLYVATTKRFRTFRGMRGGRDKGGLSEWEKMVVGAAGVQGCGVPNKFEGRLGCTVGEPPHTNTLVGPTKGIYVLCNSSWTNNKTEFISGPGSVA